MSTDEELDAASIMPGGDTPQSESESEHRDEFGPEPSQINGPKRQGDQDVVRDGAELDWNAIVDEFDINPVTGGEKKKYSRTQIELILETTEQTGSGNVETLLDEACGSDGPLHRLGDLSYIIALDEQEDEL